MLLLSIIFPWSGVSMISKATTSPSYSTGTKSLKFFRWPSSTVRLNKKCKDFQLEVYKSDKLGGLPDSFSNQWNCTTCCCRLTAWCGWEYVSCCWATESQFGGEDNITYSFLCWIDFNLTKANFRRNRWSFCEVTKSNSWKVERSVIGWSAIKYTLSNQ